MKKHHQQAFSPLCIEMLLQKNKTKKQLTNKQEKQNKDLRAENSNNNKNKQ